MLDWIIVLGSLAFMLWLVYWIWFGQKGRNVSAAAPEPKPGSPAGPTEPRGPGG